jgi:hypothetical protein
MPGTPGPRTGLATINPTGENPSILRTTANAVIAWLEANAMLTSSGLFSARPVSSPSTPGISGRRYYATDTGVEYRDTGTGWIALGVELVTALPTAPYNGQVIDYLADATNGVIWRLRYRAASTSAYKWEFVGGQDLFSRIGPAEGTASGTYTDLATVGPDITVPLAGDYRVAVGASPFQSTVGQEAWVGLSVAGTTVDLLRATQQAISNANMGNLSSEAVQPAVAAASLLRMKYHSTGGGTASFASRWLRARPVRVG